MMTDDKAPMALLVHNIGHHDLYLLLGEGSHPVHALVRNYYLRSVATRLLEALGGDAGTLRLDDGPVAWLPEPVLLGWTESQVQGRLEVGRADEERLGPDLPVTGLHFPVIDAAMTCWQEQVPPGVERVLLLTSSAPEEPALSGTGTHGIARVMKHYIEARWGEHLRVLTAPPLAGNPFHHGSMAPWRREHFDPQLRALRAEVVRRIGDDWQRSFGVALSLSTGTEPMVAAIRAALRPMSPATVHVPRARQRVQLSTPLDATWLDIASVERLPAEPAAAVTDPILQFTIQETRRWRDRVAREVATEECQNEGQRDRGESEHAGELKSFWLRKGLKPVLAVLVIERMGRLIAHPAMNLEVSLPTGTLCAERNAIGTALAADPGLRRTDLRAVAVLSLPDLKRGDQLNPLAPCGACMEWLRKVAEVNPDFRIITFDDDSCERIHVCEVD